MVVQRWDLEADGVRHRVEADTGGWRKHLRWWVDDALVADVRTADDRVELEPFDAYADAGRVALRFSGLGRPRRATWYAAAEADRAALGVGGTDLVPEAGSPAATHEERLREHPQRYAAQRTAAAVAGVVLPLLLGLLAVRFAVRIPWPDWDLPSLPSPDLPSVPWPDLPSVPWPDWAVPGWVEQVLDAAKYVVPVVVAYVVARGEVRRRRAQDERRDPAHDRRDDTGPEDPTT